MLQGPKNDKSEARLDAKIENALLTETERWSMSDKPAPGTLQFWARTIFNPSKPSRYIILALPEHIKTEELIQYLEHGFPWPVKERDL